MVRASEMAFYDLIHYGPYLPSFVNVNSTYLPPAEEFGIRVKVRHRLLSATPSLSTLTF